MSHRVPIPALSALIDEQNSLKIHGIYSLVSASEVTTLNLL